MGVGDQAVPTRDQEEAEREGSQGGGEVSHRSPVVQTSVELHAAVQRSRKVEAARAGLIHLEPVAAEPCGRTYDGNDYCTRPEGHSGRCNVKRPEDLE